MLSLRRAAHRQLFHCERNIIKTCSSHIIRRTLGTESTTTKTAKIDGDISDTFVQLAGREFAALPRRFADQKARLIAGHEDELQASWDRLLRKLAEETQAIAAQGSQIVPEIDFASIDNASEHFKQEHRKRGVAVIRGVVPEQEALRYKQDLQTYIRENPATKAFPQSDPQVFELYWSPSQLRARSHPNLLKAQKFLMQFWHSVDPQAEISTRHPVSYADRLRIRLPGDDKFALGPHVDGGSAERWEDSGYGRGHVYDKIFSGKFEEYDPFESSGRLKAVSNLYNGHGACSMFRMYQGWLGMSHTGPFEGTLLVNPLLGLATSYMMLRPFFSPVKELDAIDYLHPSNWKLNRNPDSWLHGATPGHNQELTSQLHPHLNLPLSMVHIPTVRPGDYVAWHCDTIHAVDAVHAGSSDSSVLYIPVCPLTELNAVYLKQQRDAFIKGFAGPDFFGPVGESKHVGRLTAQDFSAFANDEAMRAFGLEPYDSTGEALTPIEKRIINKANKILDFYH